MGHTVGRTAISRTRNTPHTYPDADELTLLAPLKAQVPPEVFTSIYSPAKSNGDGYDRENLLKADALLKQAGWVLEKSATRG